MLPISYAHPDLGPETCSHLHIQIKGHPECTPSLTLQTTNCLNFPARNKTSKDTWLSVIVMTTLTVVLIIEELRETFDLFHRSVLHHVSSLN